ncbi:MAG: glycosyltransferase family 9 protein [Planctomycetota bacterium]|jgi:hypothetical protein|nr:glycosyltransferase family 9 protein [Planctomycetota bacterium]
MTPRKIVVVRSGALGDVLAIRGVIRLAREHYPGTELILLAPGERGRLFLRPGWADAVHDPERGVFSWLFSREAVSAPSALRAIFADCDCIWSYAGWPDGPRLRLARLAPAAGILLVPSRPPEGAKTGIGEWLLGRTGEFCPGLAQTGAEASRLAASRFRLAEAPPFNPVRPYAVLHPGSGGTAKNWPLAYYIELARRFSAALDPAGRRIFPGLYATAGEPDGDLGRRLAAAVPGMSLVEAPPLGDLARLLAHASLYVGNDSGVSHLAAAVENGTGGTPEKIVIFGPSDPVVWGPPGARTLSAGRDMSGLSPEAVWRAAGLPE